MTAGGRGEVSGLESWLLDFLACPSCGSALKLAVASSDRIDGSESRLDCACGCQYPVRRGVPRFQDHDDYTASFSFEWGIHRRTQFDAETGGASTRRFIEVTGLRPEDLRGKTVLDAGVGNGRFAEVAVAWGARVVGMDLSYSVDVAQENVGVPGRAAMLQGDVFSPPLRPASFDVIYSIGVLQHTPDPERAFRSLVPLLKPGGSIAVYLFPRYGVSWRISDAYRRVTVHLPRRLLYALSHVAIPLYYLGKLPLLGPPIRLLIPISDRPNWRWRVLDTFNWYSPPYQAKHTYPEVYRWFRSCCLVDIELMDAHVCLRGRRPEGTVSR